jgi:hypothetical protein
MGLVEALNQRIPQELSWVRMVVVGAGTSDPNG